MQVCNVHAGTTGEGTSAMTSDAVTELNILTVLATSERIDVRPCRASHVIIATK